MDKEQPPSSEAKQSLFRRILQFSRLVNQPDSPEDLEHEIQELIEEGEEQGFLSSHESRMLSSIFEFRDTFTREIMTPATDIVSAPVGASHCDIIKLIRSKGYSRIPIYEEAADNIIGFLHAKQLLTCSQENHLPPIREMLNPPSFVKEDDKIVSLLLDFQTRKQHMAFVTDEFGSIRGLVTMEDILEEIVGEISDETDMQEEEWQVMNDNTVITSAKVDIEKIETFFELEFPEGRYESVGGFIIHQVDRIPESGEQTAYGPLTFTVLSASKRRIRSVKIEKKT